MEQNNQGAAKVVTAFVTFQEESSKAGMLRSTAGRLPPRCSRPLLRAAAILGRLAP
jgi:hypothetical protein